MKSQLLIAILFTSFIANAQCPNYGDAAKDDTKRRTTNINKNRKTSPKPDQIDPNVTITKMLNSKDKKTAFSEKKAAIVTGYILKASPEGKESCNCHSGKVADHDIHVFIAPSKNVTLISQCIVVEITPWVKKNHPEWTVAYLNANSGKKVEITGWLLYDWEHLNVSAASNVDLESAKRGTVWELHPFTSLKFK
jgi:hypothetical protein